MAEKDASVGQRVPIGEQITSDAPIFIRPSLPDDMPGRAADVTRHASTPPTASYSQYVIDRRSARVHGMKGEG